MKLIFTTLALIVTTTCLAPAGEKMSDAEIKQKLLGYWLSPRHGYHIAADGIIYMCPRKYATTTSHWAVKDGRFYWGGSPHTIVTLNDKKSLADELSTSRALDERQRAELEAVVASLPPDPRGGTIDITAPLPPHMQQSWSLIGFDANRYDPIVDAPEE